MSWSSRVEVGGRKMTVIYAAAQLPISTGVGPWQKSREVRRHLERTHTKYCFAASRAGEGIEVWWSAEERGVSIAASLDNWYSTTLEENDETPDDCIVIITFDTSVYLAEVANGLVRTERIVDENSALAHLDRYRAENRVMYGFAAGSHIDSVEQYVELEPLPFDLRSNRFEWAFAVFLRHRLYHPMVIVPVLTLFSLVTLSQIDLIGLWDRIMKNNRTDPAEQQEPVIPIVSHGGGRNAARAGQVHAASGCVVPRRIAATGIHAPIGRRIERAVTAISVEGKSFRRSASRSVPMELGGLGDHDRHCNA